MADRSGRRTSTAEAAVGAREAGDVGRAPDPGIAPDPDAPPPGASREDATTDELLERAREASAGDGSSKADREVERELIKKLLLPRKRGLALLAFISFVTGLFEALFLLLVTQTAFSIADESTDGVGPVLGQTISVGTAVAAAIVLVVLRLFTGWLGVVQGSRITKTVSITLGRDLTDAFLNAGWEAQHGDRPGRLQELLTSFARHGVAVTGSAAAVVRAALSVLVLLAAAVVVNPVASLIAIFGVFLLGGALRPLRTAVRRQSKRTTETSMNFATALSEVSDLGMEMNVFGVQPAVGARVDELIIVKERQAQRLGILKGMVPLVYSGMAYLAIVIALGFVSKADADTAASAGAAMLVMLRSLSYGQLVQTSWAGINASIPYYRILDEEIERYREARVIDHEVPIVNIGEIRFDDVSYAYTAGQPVLHNVTATLEENEVIGIIGPSGGGKSTLVQLLLGLRRPDEGRVLSNGRDIDTLSRTEWSRKVTFVPQHNHLVAGTIEDNIRFFRENVTHDDVVHAAEMAQLAGDIEGFEEGYEREVGERGSHLSGGQQQRLTIARALVEQPDPPDPRRADERPRRAVRGDDPGHARRTPRAHDDRRHRPPPVDARHLRPADGDPGRLHAGLRPAGGTRARVALLSRGARTGGAALTSPQPRNGNPTDTHYPEPTGERRQHMNQNPHLAAIKRRWWLVVALALLGAVIGAIPQSERVEEQATSFTATHTMLSNEGGNTSIVSTSQVTLFATEGEVPARVAERLDFSGNPAELAAQVNVQLELETGALRFTTTQASAADAEELADAFAEELNSYLAERQDQVYQERLQASRDNVAELSDQLDAIGVMLAADPDNAVLVAERDAISRVYGLAFEQNEVLESSGGQLAFTTLQSAQAVPQVDRGLSAPHLPPHAGDDGPHRRRHARRDRRRRPRAPRQQDPLQGAGRGAHGHARPFHDPQGQVDRARSGRRAFGPPRSALRLVPHRPQRRAVRAGRPRHRAGRSGHPGRVTRPRRRQDLDGRQPRRGLRRVRRSHRRRQCRLPAASPDLGDARRRHARAAVPRRGPRCRRHRLARQGHGQPQSQGDGPRVDQGLTGRPRARADRPHGRALRRL